jgi:hypothetical protein
MEKQEVISKIQNVLVKWGEFSIGEVDGEDVSPCVASHGNLVDLAEYFNNTGVTVEVYNPSSHSSDSIDTYDLDYEDLELDVLEEILMIAERYDVQQEKLFDSCRDENF